MTVIERLRTELEAEENSFLLQLRCELRWDRDAFLRLIDTMQRYLESDRATDHLPRWVAEGFWHLDHFVEEWSSHPSFPRTFPQSYYDAAFERLHDLAYWLFVGESPYENGTLGTFDP